MKKQATLMITILLAVGLTTMMTSAQADGRSGGNSGGSSGGSGGGSSGEVPQLDLNLTPEQSSKINAIKKALQEEIEQADKAVKSAWADRTKAIESGTDEEILETSAVLGQVLGKRGVLEAQQAREINKILTPEQLEKQRKNKAWKKKQHEKRMKWIEKQRKAGNKSGSRSGSSGGVRRGRVQ